MSLEERLDKIRSSPKLQNQQQTSVVLNAIEDTLRSQNSPRTPTAYFAALLSLLGQYISVEKGVVNKEVTYSVVYLLDLVTDHVPAPLLRSKFPQILSSLAPAFTHSDAEAPLLRASIGCLESLLVAQDAAAWGLPQSSTSARGAVGGLLQLAMDHRPKVRKRSHEALVKVLSQPPPSPSLDHLASDMCAETALRHLQAAAEEAGNKKRKQRNRDDSSHDPNLMHALQLVKTVATAQNGWPSKKIDALCEVLLAISRGSNEFLTMAAFEIFEVIFAGFANESSSSKLPRLLDVIMDLQPSQNDSQLLPPWIAVLSRGYDVSAQIEPEETFEKLPSLCSKIATFLAASSHNIRVSASECLISLLNTCVPDSVILEPSIMDEKTFEGIAKVLHDLLNVKYQSAWMEVFNVLSSAFEVFKWRSHPLLDKAVKIIGDLRTDESFAGKKEADSVLAAAISAMGPENVLNILPLNLSKRVNGQSGRVWLIPIVRDSVSNTDLSHFRRELVPESEALFQRVLNHGPAEKTVEIKVYETVVSQIWSCLPGYCELPRDLTTAFDQSFAEMLSNLLYQQPQMRTAICKALQNLVDTNKAVAELTDPEDLIKQGQISKTQAQENLKYLAGFASNLLAVLFNVYSQTLPHNRGNLLQCINAYLSITPEQELLETFQRVAVMLEGALAENGSQTQADKQKDQASNKDARDKMPPTSHTLMDLIITISTYLPRESFAGLFNMAANVVNKQDDPQLQKKAYKLIPRLSESEIGRQALADRNTDLQQLLLTSADKASAPARRDRLASIAEIIPGLPKSDLHFIPSILSEAVISAKEVNEKARAAAFDLLVLMGEKMNEGGTVVNAKVPHMSPDSPNVPATLEEYFTMVSAGLAGATPHMISATITALSRLLFEFHQRLQESTITDLVQTMDLFLTSKNREIVRSVLGFVKVCIISLPIAAMLPRLESLIPNLIVWSHEHKAHFKAKVKHIFERMIRRFGADTVEQHTPESDRKLIANIRKTRDRRKRKRNADDDTADAEDAGAKPHRSRFENEFDEAVHGSDSDAASSGSDISDDEVLGRAVAKGKRAKQAAGGKQYIVEDEDEPLDLLDRRALAQISSTKPSRARGVAANAPQKLKAKTDLDGKLVFNEDADDDDDGAVMQFDDQGMVNGREPGDGSLQGGIDAYVSAIKGQHAPQRGQRGKLKFKNVRDDADDDGADEMDLDPQDSSLAKDAKRKLDATRGRRGAQRGGRGFPQRRPLGMDKSREAGVGGGRGGSGGAGRVRKASGPVRKHGLQSRRGGRR